MTALLLVSHGTASPQGQGAVRALADAVAAEAPVRVELAHVDVQLPDTEAGMAAIGEPAVLVPLLLSAGYHVHVDLTRAVSGHNVELGRALGPDRRLARVLAERLAPSAHETVILAVAGSSDERANDDARAMARLLADELGREVTIGFLAATRPTLDEAIAAQRPGQQIAVSSYLLAPGYFQNLATKVVAGRGRISPPILTSASPTEVPTELVELVLERYAEALRNMTTGGADEE